MENQNLLKNEKPTTSRSPSGSDISMIADEKLFELCRQYGRNALFWRRKFEGLLPEVFKRHLYEKKGFSSIFEFAYKLAGLSQEQVKRILHVHTKLEDKPLLQNLLVSGEVSVSKLERVVSIATEENQEILTEYVKKLPKSALEQLVRDEKYVKIENGFNEPLLSVPRQKFDNDETKQPSLQINSPEESQIEIFRNSKGEEITISKKLKEKMLELEEKGIDMSELFLKFLEKREQDIAERKEKLSAEAKETNSRYINVETKKLVRDEQGTKCSIRGCTNDAEDIHHTQYFFISHRHDPKFLAQLCREHHEIAHVQENLFHIIRNKAVT